MADPSTSSATPGISAREALFAGGIVAILAILFLPVPTALIDLGLAASIALSVLVLMLALWIDRPLDFSSFPTVLLIATMLRLSLNVATTRAILSGGHGGEGAAGGVIEGFATLVMGGDFLIGTVVFLILVTVNFVVITKGAGRIAEVSARFTLDGIPGKQMAIDADVAAGTIDEAEARRRRAELEEETSFFGAMDGASKFVRGDAIAGLLITGVNIVGGIAIGALRHGMSVGEAADAFVRLSVGDGLVSQIPALIVSLAAGLVVSKGATRGSAERAVMGQVGAQPHAMLLAAVLMLVLALVPGLPFLPFTLLAVMLAALGVIVPRRRDAAAAASERLAEERTERADDAKADVLEGALDGPELEIAMGAAASAALTMAGDELNHRMGRLRRRFAARYGIVVPDVALRTDPASAERAYAIRLHGAVAARGEVAPGEVLVVPGERVPSVVGEPTLEPAFGLAALRVPASAAEALRREGFRPIDPTSAVLTHLAETLRGNLDRILTHRTLRGLVARLDPETRKLAEALGDGALGWGGLLALMRALLTEGVSVRAFGRLVEAASEVPPGTRREVLVEHVRGALAHQICSDLAGDGPLHVVRLGSAWETAMSRAIQRDAHGQVVRFDVTPDLLRGFAEAIGVRLPRIGPDPRPALVTTPELRSLVRMILERIDPDIAVLAHAEIPHSVAVEIGGELDPPRVERAIAA